MQRNSAMGWCCGWPVQRSWGRKEHGFLPCIPRFPALSPCSSPCVSRDRHSNCVIFVICLFFISSSFFLSWHEISKTGATLPFLLLCQTSRDASYCSSSYNTVSWPMVKITCSVPTQDWQWECRPVVSGGVCYETYRWTWGCSSVVEDTKP